VAVEQQKADVVKVLLDKGAKVATAGGDESILKAAEEKGDAAIVDMLKARGAK
jgi:hypothetical protein